MRFYFGIAPLLIIIFTAGTANLSFADKISNIWSDPVASQPFEKQPFRPIVLPEWVENLTSITYCFSVIPPELRERAAKAGAQMSEVSFLDPFSAYYDSRYIKARNNAVPSNHCAKEIEAYKKLGVRVLAVVPPGLQAEAYKEHPEWRRIPTNTTKIPEVDPNNPFGGMLCFTGPWGDRMIDIMAEILTNYPDVDAFSFDGIHHACYCYCKNCRDDYRGDTGKEIPDAKMEDPEFREYLQWMDRRMESLVQRMQIKIKSVKPEAALVTWTTNAGRFGHFMSIPRNMPARLNTLFDAPDQEFWMDETNRGNSVAPAFANAYIWAVTNHRVAFSSPYLMSHGNPYGIDSFPPQEVLPRILLVLTYGARPSYALALKPPLVDAMIESLGEVKKREKWITHIQPEPWAAMVMSDNTNCFYGREPLRVEEKYLSNVFGVFRTSIEEHLPLTIINDWNITNRDLSRYKVLVLPNTACLDEKQVAAIREYVKAGGGLVAGVDTSLYDEFGNQRDDFALADVLGVHYKGIPNMDGGKNEMIDPNFLFGVDSDYWKKRWGVFDFIAGEHSIFDDKQIMDYIAGSSVTFRGQAVSVEVESDVQTIAKMTPRVADAQSLPAIMVRQYGKGRVVYFAAGIDSAYYLYSYPYQRLILSRAIQWAASEQPSIQVSAPMCVHSTFYRQKKNGERLVVHLFNDLNTTSNHAKSGDDVPLREEFVPISDIKLRFSGYDISSIHLEPQGDSLQMTRTANEVEVTVPKILLHSMVIAELK